MKNFFILLGFRTLEIEDQKTLLKSALIELSLFRLAYRLANSVLYCCLFVILAMSCLHFKQDKISQPVQITLKSNAKEDVFFSLYASMDHRLKTKLALLEYSSNDIHTDFQQLSLHFAMTINYQMQVILASLNIKHGI